METNKTTPVKTFCHSGNQLKLFVKLLYGRHTVSAQAGQGPKDKIYVLESMARVQINNAPIARAICGSPICAHRAHILNERGIRKSGILKEVNRNWFHPTSDKLQILQVIM